MQVDFRQLETPKEGAGSEAPDKSMSCLQSLKVIAAREGVLKGESLHPLSLFFLISDKNSAKLECSLTPN